MNKDPQVIRPIDDPYSQTGGLAVLKGNLARTQRGTPAVVEEMLVHVGPARVFDCEEDAIDAIKGGKIGGRRGSYPLCGTERRSGPEMLNPTSAIAGMGLDPAWR